MWEQKEVLGVVTRYGAITMVRDWKVKLPGARVAQSQVEGRWNRPKTGRAMVNVDGVLLGPSLRGGATLYYRRRTVLRKQLNM